MSYAKLGADASTAQYAAQSQSQSSQEQDASSDAMNDAVLAAKGAVAPLDSVHIAYFFKAAALAAAKVAAKECPSPLTASQCSTLAKQVASDVAGAAEKARSKSGFSYALAYPTPSGVTSYTSCVGCRDSVDATYGLVIRKLIDIYYGLWPAEAKKAVRSDNKLVLPSFSTKGTMVPARTVDKRVVKLLQGRIVANGGAMTADGMRPSTPYYCNPARPSSQYVTAAQSLKDERYDPLLDASKNVVAELVAECVTKKVAKSLQAGSTAASTAATPAPLPGGDDSSLPPDGGSFVPEQADAAASASQAGMLGVPLKWWLIGGAAVVGVWFLTRKRS
jgi:hypothetical protein